MFNKRYILLMLGSMMIILVAFIFLTRELNWNYVSDLYKNKDEPVAVVVDLEQVIETEQLQIFVSLDEEQFERLDQLQILMDDSYPHIEVILTNVFDKKFVYNEWEQKSKLDELGDVQLVPNEWILPLATKGLLQPVDRLMNSDSLASHLPGYTDALKWNGYLWGIPYSSSPHLILSHKLLQQLDDEAIDDPVDAGIKPTENPLHNSTPEATIGTEMEGISNWDHMLDMFTQAAVNDAELSLLNVDNYDSMLVWLTYGDIAGQSGITNGELSEEQQEMLQWFNEHNDKIQLDNDIDKTSTERASWPLYYTTTWEQYMTNEDELLEHYDANKAPIPVPWLNGYSLVIQANSKQATAAMEWIEKVTQHASANALQYKEAPTRNFEYRFNSNSVVSSAGFTLDQKLVQAQMMEVSPNWPLQYARMNEQWNAATTLSDKLELLTKLAADSR